MNHESFNRLRCSYYLHNPLSANPTKWSNTLKQFVGNLPTNCLSVFDHFVILALKWLNLVACLQHKLDPSNHLSLGAQKGHLGFATRFFNCSDKCSFNSKVNHASLQFV